MTDLPKVKTGLQRHSLDQQVLIYDGLLDRIHLLDITTACVLELLQSGISNSSQLDIELKRRLGNEVGSDLIELALDALREAELLVPETVTFPPLRDVSRRELVLKLAKSTGAAALLVPAITTVTWEAAYAQATTCTPRGGSCLTTAQCCVPFVCDPACNVCCEPACAVCICATGICAP